MIRKIKVGQVWERDGRKFVLLKRIMYDYFYRFLGVFQGGEEMYIDEFDFDNSFTYVGFCTNRAKAFEGQPFILKEENND